MTLGRMPITVITSEVLEKIRVPKAKTNWGQQIFVVHAVKDWNSVPEHIKKTETLTRFKNFLATNF